jgi:hypothetical protein
MNRRAVLASLIQFDISLSDLRAKLSELSWDSDTVITLKRDDVAAILRRFENGEFDEHAVEAWANLVEVREDIRFELEHEETIATAIHKLANPYLHGQVKDIVSEILVELR